MVVAGLGILWFGALALMIADGRRRRVQLAAIGVLVAALATLVVLLADVLQNGTKEMLAGDWPIGIGIRLRADALGLLFAITSLVVVVFSLFSDSVAKTSTRTTPTLALFMSTGLTGLFLTGDVFSFFVFFELSMIAAYALTATGGHQREIGGAFIFAITNLLGSFLFLMAVAAVYHVTGTLDMEQITDRLASVESSSTVLIAVTFFVAFGTKLGLFPFHYWLPTIYLASRPPIAAILSGALASIGAYGLVRFGAELMGRDLAQGAEVLALLGIVSVLYGSIQAFSRTGMAEVLAYSSIGQAGYILVALAIGGETGIFAAVLFAITNALNKALLFLAVGLRGRVTAVAFAIGALSVAGVPPSSGFFGKLAIFQAGVEQADALLVGLILLGAVLTFLYMFRCYQSAFWVEGGADRPAPRPRVMLVPVVILAAMVLGLGLWPEPLVDVASQAAADVGVR